MRSALKRFIAGGLLVTAAGVLRAAVSQPQLWQADVQVRTVEVTKSRSGMTLRVVVYTENDDPAQDARLLVLLPVGVGIDRLAPGCAAAAGPAMVPSLRATVACDLGSILDRGYREVHLATTLPPEGLPKRFGVFAYSSTPDPVPGNNYAERTIP
jgi:hypothetical protein